MLDGATAMDPGRQPSGHARQRRGARRSEGRDLDLPGGVRPLERPADQRRHQERHQPVPRLALRRRAQLEVEREQQDATSSTAIRSRSRTRRDWGFAIGGPVGQAGRQQQAVLLLQPRVQPARRSATTSTATACRPRSSARATSRSRATTSATCIPSSRIRCSPAPASAATPGARASRTAACSAGFRQNRCIRPGLNILNWWPTPNIAAAGGPGLQLRERRPEGRICSAISRSSASTTSRRRTSAAASSSSSISSRTTSIPGTIPGLQRHAGGRLRHLDARRHVQLDDELDDVRRGVVRRELPPPGRLLGHRRRAELLPQRAAASTPAGNRNLSGFGDIPYLFPDATVLDPNTFTYWVLNQVDTTMWDGTRIVGAAAVRLGHARRQSAAPELGRSATTPASPAAPTSSSTRATAPGTPA